MDKSRGLLVRKLVITLFCIALLIPSRGNTLGLGEIELHSSLNEELKAVIALTSVGQESAETIIVKLASRADFSRAGIDRPFILNDLKFKVKIKNAQPYIEVSSKKAIREPFLSFLLDIDWPRGHILREFTMLLDPPVFMQASPEGVPTKAVVAPQSINEVEPADETYDRPGYEESSNTNSNAVNTRAEATDAPVAHTQRPPQTQQQRVFPPADVHASNEFRNTYQPQTNNHRVQKNDTAWKIAEKLRQGKSVSVEQMMMALLRRNPEAFIRDNINLVKRGYILRIPEQQDLQAISHQTALLQVKEQYALWREYNQSQVAARSANKIDRDGGSKADPKPGSSVEGRLTIASAAEGEASDGATSGEQNPEAVLKQLRKDLAATTEELESGKLENSDLKERVSSLQARMKKMERLLNLSDAELANLQSDLDAAPADASPAAEMKDETAEVSPPMVDMKADDAMGSDEAMAADEMTESAQEPMGSTPESAMEMDAISSTQPAEESVFKDDMAATDTMGASPQAPVEPPMQAVDLGDLNKGDLIEEILNDPKMLPAVIGIPALIIILGGYVLIRRKKAKKDGSAATELPETGDFNFDEVTDIVDNDFNELGNEGGFNEQEEADLGEQLEAFAEEAETEVDVDLSGDEDVISLEEDQAAPAEDEEKDDVLAEADVYLAYGIYQQAEELLKTAVVENPDRNDYKIKLLETYFASKDKSGFISVAEPLSENINRESAEWSRVIAMGRELDSGNSLFRDAGDISNFDVDDFIPQKPETDFDLGDEAADFDLGEAIDSDNDFDLALGDSSLDDDSLDDDIAGTVLISPEEAAGFDLGDGALDESDNFALNDDGLDELDQELAGAGELDSEMDFGIDELDAPTDAVSAEAAPAEEVDEGFSLDFEMADLGFDETNAEISVEETEAVATAMSPEEIDNTEFELPEDDLPEEELSVDLSDLDGAVELELEPEPEVDLDMGDLDLGEIDLSADLTDDSAEVSLDMPEEGFDLGGTDLASDEDDEPIDISTLPDDLDEVNTKLDLARAYIDMGDGDGAASILREVIEEGAGEQKQAAESLLEKIA